MKVTVVFKGVQSQEFYEAWVMNRHFTRTDFKNAIFALNDFIDDEVTNRPFAVYHDVMACVYVEPGKDDQTLFDLSNKQFPAHMICGAACPKSSRSFYVNGKHVRDFEVKS